MNVAVKPGYRQTEVGVIPEEWEVSTVGREFEVKLGKMLDAEKNSGSPKPYIGNRAVQWDHIDISELSSVPMTRSDMERFRLQKGDLLVCEGGEVGRAAIWDAPIKECYYQKALHRLRPLRGFDVRVMRALLRHWSSSGVFTNYVTQTSIAHLPREKFIEMPMPVPSAPEQRAIATALSDVDVLLGALDRLIAKKRDLKQAAMQQLLTGQTRLPGFRGEWEVKRLGDLFEITSSKRVFQSEWKSEGIPFYRARELAVLGETGQVDNELFITKSLYGSFRTAHGVPEVGDMLVTGVGTLGKVYVVRDEEEFYFKDGNIIWFKIRGAMSAEFLRQLYLTKVVMKQITDGSAGTTVGTYTISGAKKTEIPFPPLPEQTAIAEVLTDMDAELVALEQRREKTRALKQAMMQELLTGRVRLVSGELKMESGE